MKLLSVVLIVLVGLSLVPATTIAYELDYACGLAALFPQSWGNAVTCFFAIMADVTIDWYWTR
jgi:hypothetical protein